MSGRNFYAEWRCAKKLRRRIDQSVAGGSAKVFLSNCPGEQCDPVADIEPSLWHLIRPLRS